MIKIELTLTTDKYSDKGQPIQMLWNEGDCSYVQVLSTHKKKEAGKIKLADIKHAVDILEHSKEVCKK